MPKHRPSTRARRFVTGVAVLGAVAGTAHAQTAAHAAIADAMRMRSVVEIAISSNGRSVAHVDVAVDSVSDIHLRRLMVEPFDGGETTTVAEGERLSLPRWSPVDDESLAYLAPSNGAMQLWIWSRQNGAHTVGASAYGVVSFAWATDGERLATIELEPPPTVTGAQRFPEAVRTRRLAIVEMRSGRRRVLPIPPGVYDDLDWSPDGSSIVVSHRPEVSTRAFVLGMDLSLIDVASGTMASLVARPGMDGSPRWSPDGRHVAFLTHGGDTSWIGTTHVAVVDSHGRDAPRIVSAGIFSERILAGEARVEWRSDSRALLIPIPRGQGSELYELPIDSRDRARVLHRFEGVANDYSFSRRGSRAVFLAATPTSSWEAYALENGDTRRLTDSNPWLDSLALPVMETVGWPSRDGLPIEGLLVRPRNVRGRVPLIVYLHGGPAWLFTRAMVPHGWLPKAVSSEPYSLAAFAASGIAVLLPNVRGSLGRGEAFRLANVGTLGAADADDVLSGVDAMISRGVADSSRLGVMGFSYGGTLAASLAARSGRFRAAQVGAAMVDAIAAYGEMDIPELVAAYAGGPPWQRRTEYERLTLWWQLDRYRTPTLIQSGDQDRRIPTSQARALYRALSERNVPVELVLYRGEGHGIARPSNQRDFMERVTRWFTALLTQ